MIIQGTAIWKLIRNTHKHPANIALHIVGSLLYALGIGLITSRDAGFVLSILLLPAGVAAFTLGHKIEGNLASITPVLVYRLVSRKVRRYFRTNRIHVQAR